MRLSDRHRYSVADRPEGEKWQSVAFYCAVASTPLDKRRRVIMWIIRPAGWFVCPLERSIDVSVGCQKPGANYLYMVHVPIEFYMFCVIAISKNHDQ